VRVAMENAEVQRQHHQNEENESGPNPDHECPLRSESVTA
jgi:hypothetical protein